MNIFVLGKSNTGNIIYQVRIFLERLRETTVVRLVELVLRTDVDCANLESLIGRRLPEVRQSTRG